MHSDNETDAHREDTDSQYVAHPITRAAHLLGLSRSTIYELLKEHELDLIKIGRRTLIPHDSLTSFLERRRSKAKKGSVGRQQ